MRNRNCEERSGRKLSGWRMLWLAAGLLLLLGAAGADAQIGTTTVQGTVYRADGSPASGTALISWGAFTTAQNQAVAAGSLSAAIGTDGFLSVNLTPNAGALPAGSFYTVVYHLSDGTVNREYWLVPASATASIASVRAELQPSTVAVQPVTPAYVTTQVAALSSNYLPLGGGTMDGPLTLSGDPSAEDQAATKHYADQIGAQNLPLTGGTLTGPLTVPSLFAKQIEGRLYADEWKTTASNGIAISLQECPGLPYACQVVAPALYAQTEQPSWAFFNYGYYGHSPQSALLQSVTLNDQRWSGDYRTVLNPSTSYPGATGGNLFLGNAHTSIWATPGGDALQAHVGDLFSATETTGGSYSQIYDNVNQSTLEALDARSVRNTEGQSAGEHVEAYSNSPGDTVGIEMAVSGPAGYMAPYDEGTELQSTTISESINVYRGTVATTPTATTLTVTPATPVAGSGEVIAGTQGDDRVLIDTSSGDVENLTASAITNNAAQLAGSTYGYFSSMTFSSVPTSTGWGTLSTAVTYPYGSETVGFATTSGTLSSGLVCIADQNVHTGQSHGNFEEVNATVSGSSFTAAWTKSHPVGAIWMQGGDCGKFGEIVADTLPAGTAWSNGEVSGTTAYPVRYVWPVIGSTDGVTELFFTGSTGVQNGGAALGFGTRWINSSSQAVNLYKGAFVISVAGANGDLTDNHFTLEPNAVGFTSGMSVEEPHAPVQKVSGGFISLSQYSPSGWLAGESWNYYGRMTGPSNGEVQFNHVPWTQYINGGGTDTLPAGAFYCQGSWAYCVVSNRGTGGNLAVVGLFPNGSSEVNAIGVANGSDYISYNNSNSAYNNTPTWDFFIHNYSTTVPVASVWSGGLTLGPGETIYGNVSAPGDVTGASINGEVTVDGTTYKTLNAAWSAAVSQAISTGQDQTVRLGPGTYPVSATLTEPTNGACVNLIGSGGTTLNADSPQVATTLTVPNPLNGDVVYLGNTSQAQGCTFSGLNVLAQDNATHGFELQWFRGLLMENVAVDDTSSDGIVLGEENTASGHQSNFLLRNVTVSFSSAVFTPANRPAYGLHIEKTAIDSSLDNITVRNALTASVYNEGTGNTGYLIHGFGYPYTCTTAPCSNSAASGSAANASYATSYVIYDTGGSGTEWTDTYVDSPAVAGFYVGANGVSIEGGHIQWPDLTSFPAANLAYVASSVTNNMLIGDVSCLGMASGANWITYANASGTPPTFSSVHHLTGCGNYYQALEPAVTTGFSSGGANINDLSGAVPRVWATPLAASSTDAAYAAQMYTGYQGDAYQAHFSGSNPFFNVTYQGTIRSNGGLAMSTVLNTASTLTLTVANKNVIANAASGPQTITLPSCYTPMPDKMSPTGLELTIIKSDSSSNAVTLQTVSSQNIDYNGVSAQTLAITSAGKRTLICGPDYNWYAY